ncbi:peptidase [Aurantiacibacter atlanticus]|uniref:Peptidase n=1 Tax=Aurantiacibacter atlanticus TaxID=1648404 RepID=A0A168M2V8_9SPHN|nr:PepSY-associated TM helix domain-containing protein [Aurantiacibacter atlanticus]ANC50496.1 peptidase [Aurantiacibacter atlanticus]
MALTISKTTVKKALSAHSWVGLVCSGLLYLICVTGTVVVLFEEWQRIEQPGAPEMSEIEPAAIQRAIDNVLATEAGPEPTTHLFVHFPTEALPRTTITTDTQAVHVAQDGSIVAPEENAWAEFLLALHYRLNLPAIAGMTIVGIMGAMMLSLSLSGILAHPRIFRDAFRLRARRRDQTALADWHNRLAVWTLPFGIAIALTGSMIGLYFVSGFGMASSAYDGDGEAVTTAIFGAEIQTSSDPSQLPRVQPIMDYMAAEQTGVEPNYLIYHDPGTPAQHVQVIAAHPQRLIFGEYYNFDGESNFIDMAGMADGTTGQQMAASIYNLHFGNFGGLPVKIAYILFGSLLSVIVATGLYIWFAKEKRKGRPRTGARAIWSGLVIGTPAMLAVTLLLRLLVGNAVPFEAIFWLGLIACTIVPYFLRNTSFTGMATTVTTGERLGN